jgi:hypothetical protein
MAEPVESAIEIALLDKAIAFAAAQGLEISIPNGVGTAGPFAPVAESPSAQWLRATVLPAPSATMGIPYDSNNRHFGYLQIDVLQGLGGGTAPMKRIVAAIAAYFPMGLALSKDGFTITIQSHTRNQVVTQGPLMLDGTAWVKIPVSIPYSCFAKPA